MVTGLIMLSLVPLIGWAGQVSFANFAIAGFGAAMYAHVGGQHGEALGLDLGRAHLRAARRGGGRPRRSG